MFVDDNNSTYSSLNIFFLNMLPRWGKGFIWICFATNILPLWGKGRL